MPQYVLLLHMTAKPGRGLSPEEMQKKVEKYSPGGTSPSSWPRGTRSGYRTVIRAKGDDVSVTEVHSASRPK